MTLLLSIGVIFAQEVRLIKGVITSAEDGQPVIGATIIVHGKKNLGTVTGIDGDFRLKVPVETKEFQVSYIGYSTKAVKLKATKSFYKVTLHQDLQALDEVVVVAYGTAKKNSFTGSAVVLDNKRLEKVPSSDISKALEGMVSGLQISSTSGTPGASTNIRLRGIGSMSASSEPLIIVDGAPYEGDLNTINPRDIEKFSVLKDAASSALYGARGANGVIIITTKSGKQGKLQVSFDARLGMNTRGVPEYDVITDPAQYYQVYWGALRNTYIYQQGLGVAAKDAASVASKGLIDGDYGLGYNIYTVPNDQVVLADGTINPKAKLKYKDVDFNDWAGNLYKPQMRQEYNLTITKGTAKNKIFFSLGYLDDKGYNLNSGFDRISSRLAYDSQVTNWLKISSSSQLSKTSSNRNADGNTIANTFSWTRSISPIYPVFKHDKQGAIVYDKLTGEAMYDDGAPVKDVNKTRLYNGNMNIVGQQKLNLKEREQILLSQNLRLDIILPYNFKFNTSATYSARYFSYKSYNNALIGDGAAYGGILGQDRNLTQTLNLNQVLTWDYKFDDFTISALLGHETYLENRDILFGEKSGFLIPEPHLVNAAKITSLTAYETDYRIEGFFSQLTADYMDKYYLSASVRRDGSSVFDPENRWGTFWSVGASWRISQEDFLKDIEAIDNMKLRFSYGAQGNDYLYLPDTTTPSRAYTPYQDLYEVSSDGANSILNPKYKGNSNITWEKNLNLDLGFEFSLWRGALSGEVDLYKRTTDDMLFNVPIPSSTGFSTSPENLGSMENYGVEFSLSSKIYSSKDFSFTIGVNGSAYKNEITKLPDYINEQGGQLKGDRILKEGGSIYDYHMVKYAGVNKENGDALYYLFDDKKKEFVATASKDYSSDRKNRQFIGSAIPKLMGGFHTSINLYGFDFSAQFAYRIGGIVYDGIYGDLMQAGQDGSNWHKDILNHWTPENKDTDVPRIELGNRKLISSSDRFVRDGSYLSLRSLNLGYTLDQSVVKKIGLSSLRIYLAGDNVALWSKKKGFDPRSELDGSQRNSTYSPMRTWSMGLTVNF